MSHLYGRILKPSHGQSFVTAWTSSLGAIPANHSPQPESASAQTTLGTSGLLSQTEFGFCDLDSASLKMSKDTSASDSEKSLESWNQSVTKRRGEYSLRLKSAHRTSASGSSSWPSPIASEVRQGFQDRSRGMKGSQESLTTVVVKDAANWLTPQEDDSSNVNPKDTRRAGLVSQVNGQANWPTPDASNHRDGEVLRKDNNLEQGGFHGVSLHHAMTKYGQAAPANPSTDGSRPESWVDWRTPQANEAGARVETLYTKDGQPARPGERAYRKTPDGRMVLQSQTINQQVEMVQNWVTPRTSGTSTRPNKTTPRQGLTLIEQAREQEKMWRTPSVAEEKNQNTSTQIYLQNQVGATPKAWATPIMGDSHLASTPEVAQKRIEEGKVTLSRQNPGKLNPRWVETLMGLPVGWVMPSCASPVTIEQTNCDFSETESCLPPQSELFAF
jgi:hypothetical protein